MLILNAEQDRISLERFFFPKRQKFYNMSKQLTSTSMKRKKMYRLYLVKNPKHYAVFFFFLSFFAFVLVKKAYANAEKINCFFFLPAKRNCDQIPIFKSYAYRELRLFFQNPRSFTLKFQQIEH